MRPPPELAAEVLGRVGDNVEAEVHVTAGPSALTRFANSYIHQNVAEDGAAVGLRVAVEQRVASASTTNTTPAGLDRLVARTLEVARIRPRDDAWPGVAPPAGVPAVDHFDPATAEASPAERAGIVKDFVAAGPELLAAGYCETEASYVAYANTDGHSAEGRYSRATLDGIQQSDSSSGFAHATSVSVAAIDGAEPGASAAARARDGIEPYDIEPGIYEVVLAPECIAEIAAFIGFYGLNAKAYEEGRSFAEPGEQQFDEHLRFIDDVTDERALGVPFDTEGTPKGRLELIGDGMVKALAHDRRTAAQAGTESTGHGLPGSEVWGPLPYTVFIGEGEETVAALIESVERGLYVSRFNYCRVLEPKTLGVTGLTRDGTFMIENGRITGAVTNLRFTQSFVAALAPGTILSIGDDARFADTEFGVGMVHAPSMRLAGWHFTGGAAG